PLIAYSVEYLTSFGIRDLIVNLHHQPDSIRDALGDGSTLEASITYSFEEEILGTSGALDRVRHSLLDDDFVVVNGKIVTSIDLESAIRAHKSRGAIATLVLIPNAAREQFSAVEIDTAGLVQGFLPASAPSADGQASPPLLFTGIQVLSPRIFDYIPQGVFSHSTTDVYPKAIASGETVLGHVASGEWYEMSTLGRYLEASITFMRRRNVRFVVGAGSTVDGRASVVDSVLWENVTVEHGAILNRCIVGANVRVPANERFQRVAIVRKAIVQEIERGYVAGGNLIVPIGEAGNDASRL
ncbi:MAG TPA: NDP-sugar synthase, partial [Blastocatellia bacterium]|nr:NDP-sugar synthase [Blastocatellia bacterium]